MSAGIANCVDAALAELADKPTVSFDQIVDRVLAGGHPIGWNRDDLSLAVLLHMRGAPILEGIAGTFQRACERATDARLPLPSVRELVRLAQRAHPGANADAIKAALRDFAGYQREQGDRLYAQADAVRRERARRAAR
jgi:hypothetical protein